MSSVRIPQTGSVITDSASGSASSSKPIVFTASNPPLLAADQLIFMEEPDKALGEGTTGIVYNGLYLPTKAHALIEVAIKVYKEDADDDEVPDEIDFIRRIEGVKAEATTLMQFQSPYIIRCYGITITPIRICLVTELMKGGNLEDALQNDCLDSQPVKLKIALSIVTALKEIHKKNYVYGDLKSANVLLTKEKKAKLADFDRTALESNIKMSGTIPYIAPEAITGIQTKKSDIYSFGILFLELMLEDYQLFVDAFAAYYATEQSLLFFADVAKGKIAAQIDKLLTACKDSSFTSLITSCIHSNPEERPDINQIITTLNLLIQNASPKYTSASSSSAATPRMHSDADPVKRDKIIKRTPSRSSPHRILNFFSPSKEITNLTHHVKSHTMRKSY
ncbi:MAG: protein kinase [Gammaproteobacteria bacterium]|nr:protein kinase [Gammaproteobacteria bacterium]